MTALTPTLDPALLGHRLYTARRFAKLTQAKLAERAGLSVAQISKLENGHGIKTGLDTILRIVYALGYADVNDLLSGEPPPGRVGIALPPIRNVGGQSVAAVRLEEYRAAGGVRPLPVYRWGSAGDPRDRESSPYPDHEEYPPVGKESLIGPNGFGVIARGVSMVGRGIHDLDVVWVNPDRPPRDGGIVLARLWGEDDDEIGIVVKVKAGDRLQCAGKENHEFVTAGRFDVIGPVVCITSTRIPD